MHIVLTASAETGFSSPLMEGALTSLAVAFSLHGRNSAPSGSHGLSAYSPD
jgi:hypothetical protein